MVGKKSGRALLREEGLQRTDNNLEFSTWPQVSMINQKNYYTDFLKRDDQTLATRLQQEERINTRKKNAVDVDRARALGGQEGVSYGDQDADLDDDVQMDDASGDSFGSKTIVFHIGSQNLRLGLATDALPKTVPMVIARKSARSEAEDCEPRPKRLKTDEDAPELWFGDEFAKEYNSMAADFKVYRRANKRRVLPNSRELVLKWNSTNPPELISAHNDPVQIDWTELPANPKEAPNYIVGAAALRIPEESRPRYHLYWPVRQGWLNENDYDSRHMLYRDFFTILEESIKSELGLTRKRDWNQYSAVFIIPDLYEKAFVGQVLEEFIRDFNFQRVCFIQESIAASFGAGFSTACIVDIGAQKTSVCCVEDGMCMEDCRINLKYGGYDVTETFVQMMLFDRFHYSDFNLMRRHDFLLAEELKETYCTVSDENINVQLHEFNIRAYGQETRKYSFKIYDEGMLSAMGYFRPAIFNNADKLEGRRKLIPPSLDLYDGKRNDPMSLAQLAVAAYVQEHIPAAVMAAPAKAVRLMATPMPGTATPIKSKPLGIPAHLNGGAEQTPLSSLPGSPAPEENGTPQPAGDVTMDGTAENADADNLATLQGVQPDIEMADRTVPLMPLEQAILTSIEQASGTDERKRRDFLGSIMLVGGGSKIPNLQAYVEMKLRAALPQYPKEILVAPTPREMDPAVVVWKGGSVFGKLRMTNDSWIGHLEYDRLGSRILNYKAMWHW